MGENKERMMALDLLRGLDMLLLTVIGPFFLALGRTIELPGEFLRQFHHAWGGFTLWDLIMPMFIFMCGAAVPFALGRRIKEGRANGAYWWHVSVRFTMLWVLGMIAQGRLLSLDVMKISLFNNTLQTIACGYLIAACVLLIPSKKVRIAVPIVLALLYAAILHFCGDYSKTGNAAIRFENWFVALYSPTGSHVLRLADPGYTWWATIPMFGAMTLCGMEATEILTGEGSGWRRAWKLTGLGAALLAVGLALAPWIPPIKHIYTFTFTAQAMGWCCLAYAGLYILSDILKFRRGTWLIVLFGQTSLFAYMLAEVFMSVPNAFARQVTHGFEHAFGAASLPLAQWFFASAFLVFALYLRRRVR